ncbi:hypothetical protein KIW84_040947 [Lathyrus oleraceus]|uniref:AB hydrolase-1 domain-containing protein n=1 Tax=Pisum sativum TaxID=3888 RepID=A0A9D4XBP4_PEA|nr:hypothetical protein KIW84_040947 [Pisum sativum]
MGALFSKLCKLFLSNKATQTLINILHHSPHSDSNMELEPILHRTVTANGINIHIAEKGQGPLILFIHGFPDLWYSWRHQITFLSSHGYRCVALDLRGYGDTDIPTAPTSYTSLHVVGDIIGLLDTIAADQEKVFVVAHDWGAVTAWYLSLYRPERIKALVNLSVAFTPRNPKRKPLDTLRAVYGNDYYVNRFQVCSIIYIFLLVKKRYIVLSSGFCELRYYRSLVI